VICNGFVNQRHVRILPNDFRAVYHAIPLGAWKQPWSAFSFLEQVRRNSNSLSRQVVTAAAHAAALNSGFAGTMITDLKLPGRLVCGQHRFGGASLLIGRIGAGRRRFVASS
jgi:hypothetical protein